MVNWATLGLVYAGSWVGIATDLTLTPTNWYCCGSAAAGYLTILISTTWTR